MCPPPSPLTVTVWCAFDDVDEENGTIYVSPYSHAGTRGVGDTEQGRRARANRQGIIVSDARPGSILRTLAA